MEESFVVQSTDSDLLKPKVVSINKIFGVKVELQADPNSEADGIQWVSIKGKAKKNIADAKRHVIALCNPDLKEHISFPGFPIFIFGAFEERIKNKIQVEFGVAVSLTDDGFIDIHGTHVDVTLAISKIHMLHKLNKERDVCKAVLEAMQFDEYIKEAGVGYHDELKTLSNVLKKEILVMLDVPIKAVGSTAPKQLQQSTSGYIPGPSVKPRIDPNIIRIDSATDESIVVVSSGSDDSDTDDDNEMDSPSKISSDNRGSAFILPPNFVIKEWIKIHYEGTNNPSDFVRKADMLAHFKTHFDLPDQEDLANSFFDRLAQRIFPQDPNYRCVKSKKSRSKNARRRLICFRRRDVKEEDDLTTAGASGLNKPIKVNPNPAATQSKLMNDWNSNRVLVPRSGEESNPNTTIPHKVFTPTPTAIQPVVPQPSRAPQLFRAPQQQPEWQTVGAAHNSRPPHHLQSWLNTTTVKPKSQQQSGNWINSLARRVSQMSNHELVHKPWPNPKPNLRHIIIDGSNVAMGHGNGRNFSCRGIALCTRFFIERGHKMVTCLVPNFRMGGGGDPPSHDAHVLRELEQRGVVKLTPSRKIRGRNIVSYDDRFIVELAGDVNGVIVSNDQYRDLMAESRDYQQVIEHQLLQYTIVGDILLFPKDPFGRNGPTLEEFLTLPETRNQRKNPEPQMKVVKVPAPLRQRNSTPPRNSIPTNPARFQHAPVTGAWLPQSSNQAFVLSPERHLLVYEMTKIMPDRETDIKKVVTDNPFVSNINQLMEILLINDTGT